MELVLALSLYVASILLAAVYTARDRFSPVLVTVAAIGGLCCGLLVPAELTLVRFIIATSGFALVMRVVDLWVDRRWPLPMRLWLCAALVDVREIELIRPTLDRRRLVAVVLYAVLAGAGWWLSHGLAERFDGPLAWALRWGGGVVLIYGIADAACQLVVLAYARLGYRIPEQHHAPILATSVGRFWSRHYNLNVGAWLSRHFHQPLRRRGRPRLGLLAAFAFSTLFHVWLAWVPLDLPLAASMGAFFVVQGLLVVVERSWPRFRSWPVSARRAWTIGWIVVSSPLFVEPFLRILEG